MQVTDVSDVPDRQFIQSYGPGRFTIGNVRHQGSVLVDPNRTIGWSVDRFESVSVASLDQLLTRDAKPEILILGTGGRTLLPSRELRAALKAAGVALEPMDTGAACRTFNVLMVEGRSVAAALVAI